MQKHEPDKLRHILRRLMKENQLSVNGWAKRATISEGALRHFMNGDKDNITYVTLHGLARAVGLSVEEMLGGRLMHQSLHVVAELPCAAADQGRLPPSDRVEWANASMAMIAMRLKDASMGRIAPKGAVIIVDKAQANPVYLDGKAVVVDVDGTLFFRIFRAESLQLEPSPLLDDASYPIISLQGARWKIVGKAVGMVTNLLDE